MNSTVKETIEIYGAEVINETEILKTLSSKKNKEVVNQFLEEKGDYDTISFLKNNSVSYLKRFFGENAFLIKSMISLYEKRNNNKITQISSTNDVFNLLREELMYLKKEQAMILALDAKCHIIKKSIISVGTLSSTDIHPREVFLEAIKFSASGIVFVHNHPSGDPTPSRADIECSKRLIEAGQILGITMIDSIIIAGNKYTSLKEQNLI